MARLILRGGRILDPANHVDGAYDLVVEDGRIAELRPVDATPGNDPRDDDAIVEDVTGHLVTPGLIDLHGHWWEGSPYGIDPRINLRGGVTCAVDAGTSGFITFEMFRRQAIDGASVRVRAFLHVAAAGLVTTLVGELQDIRYARPRETAAVVNANRDVLVGVKVRIGSEACGRNGAAALEAALDAASGAGVPLMAHIAEGADVAAVVRALRPGDIVTHALTGAGAGILDGGRVSGDVRRVSGDVRDARGRGVRFDVGHGCGSFSWTVARAALDDGLEPDSISTDLHRYSVERPVVDLPLTMSKFLHLGMSLDQVVAASTVRPAAIAGLNDLGTLRPGGPADITVLRWDREGAALTDSMGVTEQVSTVLRPVLTIVGGVVHRADEIEVPLRPYLEADLLVDCSVPV